MSNKDKKILLDLAKNTIAKNFNLPYQEVDATEFNEKKGAFVTLKLNGKLRGCIGYIFGIKPLYQEIIDLSLEAAFEDYRFDPLTKEEFLDIDIEISILSEPKLIKDLSEFKLSRDGIILSLGYRKAVFLPVVADEMGWNKEQLLQALSKKAGLAFDAYKSEDAQFLTFTAEVIN